MRSMRIARLMTTVLAGVGQGAAPALLPFSDDFTRADGDVGNGWSYTAGKWTIATNKAVGTPALSADNKAANGTFDADSDWIKGSGWTIPTPVASRDGTAGQSDIALNTGVLANRWYQMDWDLVSHNSGGGFSAMVGNRNSVYKTGVASYVYTTKSEGTSIKIRGNGENGTVDNVVVREITLADMIASREFGASTIDIRAGLTVDQDSMAGLVLGLDSAASPANFLIVYVRLDGLGNKVMVDKCLAGTYSNLNGGGVTMSGNTVYGAGKILRVVKSGANVDVYYNGYQVGTTIALTAGTDDAIINGTRHGMFTPKGGGNRLDDFFCSAPITASRTVFLGGSNTVGLTGTVAFRLYITSWLLGRMSDTTTSLAVSGTDSWYGAVRIASIVALNPTHIFIEFAINDSVYFGANASDRTNGWKTAMEALVVRLRTALPNARLIFINLSDGWDSAVYQNSGDAWEALCTKHDIDHYRLEDYLTVLLGHTPTSEEILLYHDGVHLTELGHQTVYDMLASALTTYYPSIVPGWSGDLSDYQPYTYDDISDWVGDPIIRNGTDNDGETGTGWSTVNTTARRSSTANDTISWTGTLTAFGLDMALANFTIAYQIDGGDFTNINQTTTSGAIRAIFATTRGSHTITIKVVSGTVTINRFLAA